MNMVPWGGPTARAGTALDLDPAAIFNPLIPALIAGILWVLFVAYILGKRERNRLGISDVTYDYHQELSEAERNMRRPKLFWFNFALTIIAIIALIKVWLPLPIVFMVAFAIALIVNYPNSDDQQEQIKTQAVGMVTVVSIIFAAGIFTGILNGTGMIEEMAMAMVNIIPEGIGGFMAILIAVISMPISLLFTPDAYYFGVMPILSQSAEVFGVAPVEIARASVLGQMTTGFPLSPLTASTFLLIGLAGVELGDHQRFIFKWAFGTTIVMTITALIIGVI
jgi:CitMHS family citrate-Mg2+:H+ or citrate-Ca2+:H+ symporter